MLSKGWQRLTGLLLLGAQGGGARARQAAGRGFLWEVGSCQGLGLEGQAGGGAPTGPVQGREGSAGPCPVLAAPGTPTSRPVQP